MTIASAIQDLNDGLLDAYTAIGAKGGTIPANKNLDNLPTAISSISGGGGEPTKKDVNFYDYDGTFIIGYAYDELASLSELPQLPSHPDKEIIATNWTSTLAQVKAVTSPNKLDVGAVYSPMVNGAASDATVLYIRPEKNVALTMTFSQSVSDGVTIDWGDGSTAETVAGTGAVNATHTYAGITAETKITITPDTGCNLILGFNGAANKSMFGATSAADNPQIVRASIGRATIGSHVFYYMAGMEEVTISSNVASIGNNAFRCCYALTSVVVPNSVTLIDGGAFYSCQSLASAIIPNSVPDFNGSLFANCYALTSVTIPNGVRTIGSSVFNRCYTLASVVIPNSVTLIGTSTFAYCSALTSVVIPNSVTNLGSRAFEACSALSDITISNSVSNTGEYLFSSCTSLTSVTIPNSMGRIYNATFDSCYALTDIKFEDRTSVPIYYWLTSNNRVKVLDFTDCEQVPTMSDGSFLSNLKPYTNIVVPDALYNDWIVATNWSSKAGQIVKESDYEG